MTWRDLAAAAAENLWRMKLRSGLTVSGIVIAIAAFVSMLSFGAGNQKYVNDQFEKFGLFSTIHVFPKGGQAERDPHMHPEPAEEAAVDTIPPRPLDEQALRDLAAVPGVRLAYPFESFEIRAVYGDSAANVNAQAIPMEVTATRALSQFVAGGRFQSDSASQVMVTRDFLPRIGVESADSLIGKQLVIEARLIRVDSALLAVVRDPDRSIRRRLSNTDVDSLFYWDYSKRLVRREVLEAMRRFLDGLFNDREVVSETLTVCGVLAGRAESPMRIEHVIMPLATARRFNAGDMALTPTSLLSTVSSGELPALFSTSDSRNYPKITLDLDPHVPFQAVRDSVKALGFRPYSFAEQFAEIQRFLLFFDMALGLVGLIALVTASLGITNTMVMSVLERRREIGVFKALGADDSDVRRIFLFEAGAIGTAGAILGILVGWAIARVASAIAQFVMARQGIDPLDLFALPLWLVAIALAIGITVSLIAGYYPARRAARLDPVDALRSE